MGRECGLTTVLNPAPAVQHLPDELLCAADYVCPNETELALLTGLPVTDVASAITAARGLQARGARAVLVTLGANGSVLLPPRDHAASESIPVHVPAAPLGAPVLDTTGAGDSFLGAFGAYLAQGLPVAECIRRATVVAGHSVTRRGTQTSFGSASAFVF